MKRVPWYLTLNELKKNERSYVVIRHHDSLGTWKDVIIDSNHKGKSVTQFQIGINLHLLQA